MTFATGALMDGKVLCVTSVSPTQAVSMDPVTAHPGAVTVTWTGEEFCVTKVRTVNCSDPSPSIPITHQRWKRNKFICVIHSEMPKNKNNWNFSQIDNYVGMLTALTKKMYHIKCTIYGQSFHHERSSGLFRALITRSVGLSDELISCSLLSLR